MLMLRLLATLSFCTFFDTPTDSTLVALNTRAVAITATATHAPIAARRTPP